MGCLPRIHQADARAIRIGSVAIPDRSADRHPEAPLDQAASVLLQERPEPVELEPVVPWVPSGSVPADVAPLLGLWFWGNTAHELRWENGRLELRVLGEADGPDVFARSVDGWRGVAGYLMGERLEVARRPDGTPDHLECATFVFTRQPYA